MAGDRARRIAIGAFGVAAIAVIAALAHVERRAVAVDLSTARDLHGQPYAGSLACRRCHEDHYRSWHRTFHRTMTQEVSARNAGAVLGDFSGVTYRHAGVDARMDRDASGAFCMTFTASDARGNTTGSPITAIVSRAIGSRRYQQYLTRIGDAEYRLPIAFHVEERRWLHMNGSFLFAESDSAGEVPKPSGDAIAGTLESFVDGLSRLGGPDYARHVTR